MNRLSVAGLCVATSLAGSVLAAQGQGPQLPSEPGGKFGRSITASFEGWYDNTKANKNNPDPEQWVGYGDRTVDEMAHAWMNVVYLSDAEYKERVDKYGEGVTNGVKPEKTTQQQQ